MKELKAIIVDDEQDGIDILKLMIQSLKLNLRIVKCCHSANEAIEAIQQFQPDLVFLDIEMPGKDGFEVLEVFPEATFKVIIVTGYDHYAVKAIKYLALDYLLKPFEESELDSAIKRAVAAIELQDNRLALFADYIKNREKDIEKIIIPSSKGFRMVHLDQIIYLESRSGNYCLFKLDDKSETMVAKALYYFEDILPHPRFFRIHRSRIVNLDKIISFDSKSGELELSSLEKVEVSIRRRSEFNTTLRSYLTN